MRTRLKADTTKTYSFSPSKYNDCHDRYLIIDGKTEIILSSGFDHLHNTTKEIAYIVRDCRGMSRF